MSSPVFYPTKNRQLVHVTFGEASVTIFGTRDITDEEWMEHLDNLEAAHPPKIGIAYSIGKAASAVQRRMISERPKLVSQAKGVPVAFFTPSGLMRATVNSVQVAMKHISGFEMKAFAPAKADEAFAWLSRVAPLDSALALKMIDEALVMAGYDDSYRKQFPATLPSPSET